MFPISVAHAADAASAAHGGGFFSHAENWVAIIFLLVVGALARPVYRAITGALDLRRERIRIRIEDAERLRADAQALLDEYQKKRHEAFREAEEIVARARADAVRIVEDGAKALEAQLKQREEQAGERLAQAEIEALREVRERAVEVAIAATARLMAEKIGPAEARGLIDDAIQDLPNRLH